MQSLSSHWALTFAHLQPPPLQLSLPCYPITGLTLLIIFLNLHVTSRVGGRNDFNLETWIQKTCCFVSITLVPSTVTKHCQVPSLWVIAGSLDSRWSFSQMVYSIQHNWGHALKDYVPSWESACVINRKTNDCLRFTFSLFFHVLQSLLLPMSSR